ncbi:MAG: T9SS type A sorting domain-containing protein [Bacteroidota bacterium]
MIKRYSFTAFIVLILCFQLSAQDFVSIEYKGQRSQAFLTTQYGPFVQNGVDLWKVTYTTPDVFNQLDTASGLLVVPIRETTTAYPTVVYQHGTVDGPQDVPSNLQGGYELPMVLGAFGYLTMAPDFLGAGEARGFHPYVHAASEASAAVDMLRAVWAEAPDLDIYINNQLFVTGYSQGGHASMALHRALELEVADEFDITAATHMSGPYSISGVMREVMISEDPYNFIAYLPNTYLSYDYVMGIYDDLEQMFKPAYTSDIQAFRDGDIGLFELNSRLIAALVAEHGAPIARYIIQDSIVTILENPDLDHPLHTALRENDVYEWSPQKPTRIFYCMADDQVNFRNSIVADSVMQMLGAVDLETIDVLSEADHGGCVEPATLQTIGFFNQFADWLVDTDDLIAELPIRVYPNPAQDWLQLEGLQTDAQLKLYNHQGKLVLQKAVSVNDNRLNLPDLPAGVYLLQIRNGNGQAVRKILVD